MEVEAVDGKLKEAEAEEKLTAVPSLHIWNKIYLKNNTLEPIDACEETP